LGKKSKRRKFKRSTNHPQKQGYGGVKIVTEGCGGKGGGAEIQKRADVVRQKIKIKRFLGRAPLVTLWGKGPVGGERGTNEGKSGR